jgi:hypothetical protein
MSRRRTSSSKPHLYTAASGGSARPAGPPDQCKFGLAQAGPYRVGHPRRSTPQHGRAGQGLRPDPSAWGPAPAACAAVEPNSPPFNRFTATRGPVPGIRWGTPRPGPIPRVSLCVEARGAEPAARAAVSPYAAGEHSGTPGGAPSGPAPRHTRAVRRAGPLSGPGCNGGAASLVGRAGAPGRSAGGPQRPVAAATCWRSRWPGPAC